jgi:hypothetical protein
MSETRTEWITPGEQGYTVCFGCGKKTYFMTDEYVRGTWRVPDGIDTRERRRIP